MDGNNFDFYRDEEKSDVLFKYRIDGIGEIVFESLVDDKNKI